MADPSQEELQLMRRLQSGEDFDAAVQTCGISTAYNCILNGWIERGSLTSAGRELVIGFSAIEPGETSAVIKTNKFEVIDLGNAGKPEKE